MTSMTPFDWYTFEVVMVAISPFSSPAGHGGREFAAFDGGHLILAAACLDAGRDVLRAEAARFCPFQFC